MNKMMVPLFLTLAFLINGCSTIQPNLEGSYQSERDYEGYIVQMSLQPEDQRFVEYIDNREVDRGTYEKTDDNVYRIKSEKQDFNVTLRKENTFELVISKINKGKPIVLKHIDKVPTYFSEEGTDVEKYEDLLDVK